MIVALLMVTHDGERRLWGVYKFVQLQAAGEPIILSSDQIGWVIELKVTHIAHEPLREDQTDEPSRYSAWVHAEWVSEPPSPSSADRHAPWVQISESAC